MITALFSQFKGQSKILLQDSVYAMIQIVKNLEGKRLHMSKIGHYLQEHLLGEVTESADTRSFFSTDMSIFSITPSVIVFPRSEHDVRKTARFTWQLAERGKVVPITARGAGTDYSGAAIGQGIVISFPAHMNRIVQLDTKSGAIIVEPGLTYGRLQQTLHTHDRFLPPFPSSIEFSTVGGAVANNASGVKSYKYGTTLDYVKSLRVVLANGEVITTGRLSKRELSKKLGLTTFEGEVYRQIDALVEEHKDTIAKMIPKTSKNTAGYNIADVKLANGSIDLTPLFVGSQGTLGIITEITLGTEDFNPETTLFMANFESVDSACEAVLALKQLPDEPSAIELVDGQLLSFIERLNPNQLKNCFDEKNLPKVVLFVEIDSISERNRRKQAKRVRQVFERLATSYKEATDYTEQTRLWKVRETSAGLLAHSEKHLKAVPIIDDAIVPVEGMATLIKGAYKLFSDARLQIGIWGHAGSGNLHIFPFFDLSQLGDRQRAFRLYEEYYKLVLSLDGSTSGQHNDGRLRAPLLPRQFGSEGYAVLQKIKTIFDPHGILNPGVKTGVSLDDIKPIVRNSYSLNYLHTHMPRT